MRFCDCGFDISARISYDKFCSGELYHVYNETPFTFEDRCFIGMFLTTDMRRSKMLVAGRIFSIERWDEANFRFTRVNQ